MLDPAPEDSRRINDRAEGRTASRPPLSASFTMSARSCRRTASSALTTACTRSGSREIPHPCRQHAAARQALGHDGRRPAFSHDGGDASSGPPRHGGLRRWRLHDELAGDGNGGAVGLNLVGRHPERQRLRHDPLEAGGGRFSGFRHEFRQSRFRALRRSLWRQGFPCGCGRGSGADAGGRLYRRRRPSESTCRSTMPRTPACWSTSCATGHPTWIACEGTGRAAPCMF